MDPKWTDGNELNYLKEVLENSDEVRKNPFTDRLEKAFIEMGHLLPGVIITVELL